MGVTVRTRLRIDDDPQQAIETLRSYQQVGVSHVVLEVVAVDLDQARAAMERLARQVRPAVAA